MKIQCSKCNKFVNANQLASLSLEDQTAFCVNCLKKIDSGKSKKPTKAKRAKKEIELPEIGENLEKVLLVMGIIVLILLYAFLTSQGII